MKRYNPGFFRMIEYNDGNFVQYDTYEYEFIAHLSTLDTSLNRLSQLHNTNAEVALFKMSIVDYEKAIANKDEDNRMLQRQLASALYKQTSIPVSYTHLRGHET
jgi:hypothetical protein